MLMNDPGRNPPLDVDIEVIQPDQIQITLYRLERGRRNSAPVTVFILSRPEVIELAGVLSDFVLS